MHSSIGPINKTLTGTTTLEQIRHGSNNSNEGVFHILQSSRTGASPSNCLVSYPGHSDVCGGRSCLAVKMQSVYSTVPAYRVMQKKKKKKKKKKKNQQKVPNNNLGSTVHTK